MGLDKKDIPIEKFELKHQSSESLHLLLDTIEGISRTMELKSLLSESMEATRIVMNAEASSLMLLDEDTGELYVSLPTGPVKEEIKGKRIPPEEGIGGWVATNKRPYISNDVENSEHFWGDIAEDFTTRNIVCVPLVNKGNEVIGVLQALNKRKGEEFTPHDIPVFQALASQVTIAIERARQNEELHDRLKENEVMFTEIHHRIKNNLATISALIEMEMPDDLDPDARYILEKTHSRIQSMTEVHDMLCKKSGTETMILGEYLERLADKISETLSDNHSEIQIKVDSERIEIYSERAMICGLVLNELLVNVFKHAFTGNGNGNGQVDIHLNEEENIVSLKVVDNGVGLPEDFDLKNSSSIGTWVVNVLLRKLNATVEIDRNGGTGFTISFEKTEG